MYRVQGLTCRRARRPPFFLANNPLSLARSARHALHPLRIRTTLSHQHAFSCSCRYAPSCQSRFDPRRCAPSRHARRSEACMIRAMLLLGICLAVNRPPCPHPLQRSRPSPSSLPLPPSSLPLPSSPSLHPLLRVPIRRFDLYALPIPPTLDGVYRPLPRQLRARPSVRRQGDRHLLLRLALWQTTHRGDDHHVLHRR